MAVRVRTDEDIQRDMLEELKWDPRVQPNEIGVAVKDGIVTLTGWVDSYLKKIAAEEDAHRVPGVKAVVNDIEVRLPSSAERTDAVLASGATLAAAGALTVGSLSALIAALIQLGMPREIANSLGEHVHKGDTLVIVHARNEEAAALARRILASHNPRPAIGEASGGVVSVTPQAV